MIKHISTLLLFMLLISNLKAQELKCQVIVNSDQVQESDKRRFDVLQSSVFEFMNNTQWTNRKFNVSELIDCSIFITLNKETSGELYKGTIQIQSRRPVFNSSYYSPMININDENFAFNWVDNNPLIFDINTYSNNLTSILAYYAYIIIGTDFDSYSLLGGTDYYNNAQTIVNNASGSEFPGWNVSDKNNNRYWFLENIMNSRYQDYRKFLYQFHRQGLDIMHEDLRKGRIETLNALALLQNTYKIKPGLYTIKSLMDAKRDEFIGIFSEADPTEKEMAKKYLSFLDPSHSDKYEKMASGAK